MRPYFVWLTFVVGAMAAAQNLPSQISILELPGRGLVLESYREARVSAFDGAFSTPEMAELEPLSLVLTNTSRKNIVGLTIRWIAIDSLAAQRITDYRTDSFFFSRIPVLAANSRVLIAPGVLVPESGGFTGSGPNEAVIAKLRNAAGVGVYLDAVIFDDGQVTGPDRSQTVAQIRARKTAVDSVLKAVSDALNSGLDPTPLLSALAAPPSDRSDLVGVWKSRVAQRLLHSHNLAKDVQALQNLSLPNFWR